MKHSTISTLLCVIATTSVAEGFSIPEVAAAFSPFTDASPIMEVSNVASQSTLIVSSSDYDALMGSTWNTASKIMFETKVFTGMAHLTLDLAAFFARGTALLRLGAVMGRMFVIGADYLPDHSINADEFLFQMFMMSISLVGFVHSVLPTILAATQFQHKSSALIKDGRAFRVLFHHVGLSWFQYKTLVATDALDWVTIPPHQVVTSEEAITDDDGVYWLYQGQVQVATEGTLIQTVTRQGAPRLGDANLGLFGETRLQDTNMKTSSSLPLTTITAGPAGATLLRLRSKKLKTRMEHDDEIAEAIRKLLFRSMQDKLHTFMVKG